MKLGSSLLFLVTVTTSLLSVESFQPIVNNNRAPTTTTTAMNLFQQRVISPPSARKTVKAENSWVKAAQEDPVLASVYQQNERFRQLQQDHMRMVVNLKRENE